MIGLIRLNRTYVVCQFCVYLRTRYLLDVVINCFIRSFMCRIISGIGLISSCLKFESFDDETSVREKKQQNRFLKRR
jgi:hypothetical protein